jgi:signal transduction histidine kinase
LDEPAELAMEPIAILLASPDGSSELSARLEQLTYRVVGVVRTIAAMQAEFEQGSPDLILVDGSTGDATELAAAADQLGADFRAAVVHLTQNDPAPPMPRALWHLSLPCTDRELQLAIGGSVALAQAERENRTTASIRVLAAIVGGVAHEYNNILTSISGNAELALFDITPEMDARLSIDQIQASVRRAIVLTRQVLALSRRSASQPETLDMNLLVGELIPLLTIAVGKRVSFMTQIGIEPIYVACAPNQLRFALIGLVIEAALAAGEGEVQISMRALPDRQYAELLVSHTPAWRQVAGAPGFTGFTAHTEEHQEVRGIGLALMQALASAAGGVVNISGQEGEPSSVCLLLPLLG